MVNKKKGKNKMFKSLLEQIAFSETFNVMGTKAYLQELRDSNSDVSVQVKMAKEYNKPVIIWMTNKLSADDRVDLERFFTGYNVIKVLELNTDDKDSGQAVIKETNRLSEDILRNRVLNRNNFIRIDLDRDHYYYTFKNEDVEICLEPCAGGFCVRVFDADQQLLESRCTDFDGYLDSVSAIFGERREDAWIKALEMANEFYKRLVVDKIDTEGAVATYIF